MENVVIQSILAEEAQADLDLSAAREKAAVLIKEAEAAARSLKEQALSEAQSLLKNAKEAADEAARAAAAENEVRSEEDGQTLREKAAERMELAADAVLYLLNRKEEA